MIIVHFVVLLMIGIEVEFDSDFNGVKYVQFGDFVHMTRHFAVLEIGFQTV